MVKMTNVVKMLLPSEWQRQPFWPRHLNITYPVFQRNGIWLDILSFVDTIPQAFSSNDVFNSLRGKYMQSPQYILEGMGPPTFYPPLPLPVSWSADVLMSHLGPHGQGDPLRWQGNKRGAGIPQSHGANLSVSSCTYWDYHMKEYSLYLPEVPLIGALCNSILAWNLARKF